MKIGETPISNIEIPVGIINGNEMSPTVCLIAGEHAVEYPGINAAIRIYKQTLPNSLNGALLIVPVMNVPGFEARSAYVSPIDNANMGFIGPGDKNGSISYRISHTVLNEIIMKSDYLLNLHGGDGPEWLAPFTIVENTGNTQVDTKSEELARVFGLEYIVKIEQTRPTLICEAGKRGIPSLVSEAGSLRMFDKHDTNLHVLGVENVLKHLLMLDGEPIPCRATQKIVSRGYKIFASRGGLFYPRISPGTIISKGDILAEIRDLKGDLLDRIIAKEAGWIGYMWMRHVVNTGDPLISVSFIHEQD
ncbi:MAG: succinylglutamate desuccinylase/aspartoacylase family protein [Candidatus Hodarchaeota archaeon]